MDKGDVKTLLREVDGITYLTFKPQNLNPVTIPVITKGSRDKSNAWTWNGDTEKPTLRPSVRTKYHNGTEQTEVHYWLTDGIAHCLSDCKDGNANKKLPLVDISEYKY